jgi:ribosome-binding protein aMBF1 (putative translation factor)
MDYSRPFGLRATWQRTLRRRLGVDPSLQYCSFCHKSQREVRLLLAASRVRICNECTALVAETVAAFHAQRVRPTVGQRSSGAQTTSDTPASVRDREDPRLFVRNPVKWFRSELKRRVGRVSAPRFCSFCGRRQDEVQVLVEASKAAICDECVGIAECTTKQEISPDPRGKSA